MVSTLSCHTPAQGPSSLPCQKWTPYKVRVAFSKPVHAARARIGPHGPNHGTLTAKPSSHHVLVTVWVTPPMSSCPHLFCWRRTCVHSTQRLWVIPCQINTKNTWPSQIRTKLGSYIVSVETFTHSQFQHYMLDGFRVRASQKVSFSPNFWLAPSYLINHNFKHDLTL